jgi:MFS family permease
LARRVGCDFRFGGIGLWISRIGNPGVDASSRYRDFDFRYGISGSFRFYREEGKSADGAAQVFSVRKLQRSESADAISLFCVGNFLLFVSVEPDSDSEVLSDGDWCGFTSYDFAHVLVSRWSGGLINRYGPKVPLIVGPLIAAVAFLLFTVPSVQARYWTAFFPAFIVLGLGMAISVAPLTTVVMNSVEQERAGTASGINNAIARVAGVLAVAVLGAVMAAAFAHSLRQSLDDSHLNAGVVQQLESNVAKLGSLDAPTGVDSQTALTIRSVTAKSFIFGFRLIMILCAALATASAGVAWRNIPAKERH